jgi:hypothetical protein
MEEAKSQRGYINIRLVKTQTEDLCLTGTVEYF